MRRPTVAMWLLVRLAPGYRREALVGDVAEELRDGRSRAWLWGQVLRAIWAGVVCRILGRGRQQARRYWRDYRGLAAFVLLMLGFRSAWADWVYVPTGSMNPTILEGDRLLVDKHVYGLRVPFTLLHLTWGEDPARGDIVVLDSPLDGTLLVKRVVAVPGDVVALDDERLIVNGTAARYTAGDPRELESLLERTRAQHPIALRESGAGAAHDILLLPGSSAPSTFGPVVVPKGMYFVLGDNRDNSADSRYIGLVPRRNIVGRATLIVASLNPDRYFVPRSARLLKPLE